MRGLSRGIYHISVSQTHCDKYQIGYNAIHAFVLNDIMYFFFALVSTTLSLAPSTASIQSTISKAYSGLLAYNLRTFDLMDHLMVFESTLIVSIVLFCIRFAISCIESVGGKVGNSE